MHVACGVQTVLHRGSIIIIAILVAHYVSTVVVQSLQCRPISKYWMPHGQGQCINITAFFYCKSESGTTQDAIR